jgi:hypothetical protein
VLRLASLFAAAAGISLQEGNRIPHSNKQSGLCFSHLRTLRKHLYIDSLCLPAIHLP